MQDGLGDKGDTAFTKLSMLVKELKMGLKDKGLEETRRSIEDLAELFESTQTMCRALSCCRVESWTHFWSLRHPSNIRKPYRFWLTRMMIANLMPAVPLSEHEKLLMNVLANTRDAGAQMMPLAVFVKTLQESLMRMETFKVSTVSSNPEG